MRLTISGRATDLARIQVYEVVDAIRAAHPDLDVVCTFRESRGDQNQAAPLWEIANKGVFTDDFVEDLTDGRADLLVHSWKDLPIEPRPNMVVAATLPRADARDVLLVREDRWASIAEAGVIEILSSSPRRAYNLAPFLMDALPATMRDVRFCVVRGSVPTRIRKLIEGNSDALVVAKAALDRLLDASRSEFASMRHAVREHLSRCRWMVLPFRANPTAPGQGALALEVARCRTDLHDFLRGISHCVTFDEVERERDILRSYGGGCHQRIGASVLTRPYGRITSLRGVTDTGGALDGFTLETKLPPVPRVARERVWPLDLEEIGWFAREPLQTGPPPSGEHGLWIARGDALPAEWVIGPGPIVWTSGLDTWKKLARRGVWVHGSAEGLGESEQPRIDVLAGRPVSWLKLTHDDDCANTGMDRLATYRLVPRASSRILADKTHFYWTSGSGFLRALAEHPIVRDGWHGCGPGNTYQTITQVLGENGGRVRVWLSHADWLAEVTGSCNA